MEVLYTKHAIKKFDDLAELGIVISKKLVSSIIKKPHKIDEVSDYPSTIATGTLDDNHVLRIVYRRENGKIVIVTFYPGRKDRYL